MLSCLFKYLKKIHSGSFELDHLLSLVARASSFGSDSTLPHHISNFCEPLGPPLSIELLVVGSQRKSTSAWSHCLLMRKSLAQKSASRPTGHLPTRVFSSCAQADRKQKPSGAHAVPVPLLWFWLSTAPEPWERWVCRALDLHCKAGTLSLLWQAGKPPDTFPGYCRLGTS